MLRMKRQQTPNPVSRKKGKYRRQSLLSTFLSLVCTVVTCCAVPVRHSAHVRTVLLRCACTGEIIGDRHARVVLEGHDIEDGEDLWKPNQRSV